MILALVEVAKNTKTATEKNKQNTQKGCLSLSVINSLRQPFYINDDTYNIMISFKETEDGSATLYNAEIDECYHSIHGARAESTHIFIKAALREHTDNNICVLEIGFGTGLNALLTAIEAEENKRKTIFHTIELYPLDENIIDEIIPTVNEEERDLFCKIHQCQWGKKVIINEYFTIVKHMGDIRTFNYSSICADIVYFDAFSPEKQPELWDYNVFNQIYKCMNDGGILSTYCSKGVVRRTMQSVGFSVEKINGPAHKRHITRARKPNIVNSNN